MTCYYDVEDMTYSAIRFSQKSSTPSSTTACDEYCFQQGLSVRAYDNTDCYCGDIAISYDCSCSGHSYSAGDTVTCANSTSSSSDSLVYVTSASWVSAGITFDSIPKLTMGESHSFTVRVTSAVINVYVWKFGDSLTTNYTKSATATFYTMSYTYVKPGTYYITVEACYNSGPCDSATVPVIVQSTSALTSVAITNSNTYKKTTDTVTMTAQLTMGQNMEMLWSKSPDDSITASTGNVFILTSCW